MASPYFIALKDVSAISKLEALDPQITRYARMTVNKALPFARRLSAASMESQINFPDGYLSGQNGRLKITKFASEDDLSGVIRGRDEATSLARFVVGGPKPNQKTKGVTVEVKPGKFQPIPSAFVIKLRNNNLGLAYRSKDGKPPASVGAKKLAPGIWLLYGPSVDQVFNETRGIIAGDIEDFMSREIIRLMKAGI